MSENSETLFTQD